MRKVKSFNDTGDFSQRIDGLMFYCPGCKFGHHVAIAPYQFGNGASWTWNGDLENPTIQPSVLSSVDFTADGKPSKICHLFVTNGQLQYLNDCSHSLAGQTIEMVDVDVFL